MSFPFFFSPILMMNGDEWSPSEEEEDRGMLETHATQDVLAITDAMGDAADQLQSAARAVEEIAIRLQAEVERATSAAVEEPLGPIDTEDTFEVRQVRPGGGTSGAGRAGRTYESVGAILDAFVSCRDPDHEPDFAKGADQAALLRRREQTHPPGPPLCRDLHMVSICCGVSGEFRAAQALGVNPAGVVFTTSSNDALVIRPGHMRRCLGPRKGNGAPACQCGALLRHRPSHRRPNYLRLRCCHLSPSTSTAWPYKP